MHLKRAWDALGIVSVGSNDKKYLKKIGKKLPKALIGLPFRIDYVIKVPKYCDLQITGGKGDLSISDVEGVMNLNYLETMPRSIWSAGRSSDFGSGWVSVSCRVIVRAVMTTYSSPPAQWTSTCRQA